jgi:hypothetical protein
MLGDFVEVVPPGAINWWPQTAGWAWLGVVLFLLAGRWGWKQTLHWYRNRYRREAQKQLQQLRAANTPVREINRLLKLTSLAAFPREQVAALSGKPWVDFLNRQCSAPVFNEQQSRMLALATYSDTPLEEASREQLLQASLDWIQRHKNPYDV